MTNIQIAVGAVTTGAAFEAATAKIAKQPNSTLLTLLDPPAATAAAAADTANKADQVKEGSSADQVKEGSSANQVKGGN